MKKLHSFKLLALLSVVAGSLNAYSDECGGPLERGSYYVMPKIGVAPGIFSGRGHEKSVWPLAGVECVDKGTGFTCIPEINPTNQNNILQQDACKLPKFGDIFSNGVLHVGFEVGRNVCDNSQVYLEFVYNRASGSCVNTENQRFAAVDGCAGNDCCPTTNNSALGTWSRTTQYDDYSAYGGYIGSRHYWNNSFFCDRAYFWGGFKFGILHRKQVCACVTLPETTETVESQGDYTLAARTITPAIFCKSNAVSGGLSLGLDYCINDCLTALIGFEVVASCAFKSNQNYRLPLAEVTVPDGGTFVSGNFSQATNITFGNTGTFVQFPIWAGLRWEFDWCNPCNPCA